MHIDLLREAVQKEASDIHITVGIAPVFRIDGHLCVMKSFGELTPADIDALYKELISLPLQKIFEEIGELDTIYSIPELSRFRVNVFRQCNNIAMVLRVIKARVPNMESLGLPEVLKSLAHKLRGLVLVTGPSGSGKSTTLAAMIDLINQERSCHIITLEDPIEYLHQHGQSIVNQREIHTDSHSFANALRASLREDPDVIMVGEMRDSETISTAITAAETGHLVLASLHTGDAVQTIDRIIDVFPAQQQQQIRIQLSLTLQGIVCQQLLPSKTGSGRVAAVEILLSTPAVRNLIREGKSHQLLSVIQTGNNLGMQTMDKSLYNLYRFGKVSFDEAAGRASDYDAFCRLVQERG